jgi:uncharacterized protein
MKCPICHRDAKPRSANATFPFCSARCKTIDLGKWLSEEYRVPVEGVDDESEGEAIDEEALGRARH